MNPLYPPFPTPLILDVIGGRGVGRPGGDNALKNSKMDVRGGVGEFPVFVPTLDIAERNDKQITLSTMVAPSRLTGLAGLARASPSSSVPSSPAGSGLLRMQMS